MLAVISLRRSTGSISSSGVFDDEAADDSRDRRATLSLGTMILDEALPLVF
jgi:hypothetical protein